MLDVAVIDDTEAAALAVEPVKSPLPAELTAPASAAALADRLGMPRQKINYHLRSLEEHGLVRVPEERRWGGLNERLMGCQRGCLRHLVAGCPRARGGRPGARRRPPVGELSDRAGRPRHPQSQQSHAARATRAGAWPRSRWTRRSASGRRPIAAFSRDLTEAIAALVSRYHDAHGQAVERIVS